MGKILKLFFCIFFIFNILYSCSYKEENNSYNNSNIKIGVVSTPYGEILDNIRKIFKLDFELVDYIDYEALNNDLVSGKLDANFFQTREYLERFNLNSETKLVELTGIHVEPLIIYSSKYKEISKINDGASVYIPNDYVNRERALKLLADASLITIEFDAVDQRYVVKENPKNLIINEVVMYLIPSFYEQGDLIIVNTDIALQNGIYGYESGIYYEDSFSDELKVNLFVTRENMKTSVQLKEIAHYLNSYETFKFISEKYRGFVKPVF